MKTISSMIVRMNGIILLIFFCHFCVLGNSHNVENGNLTAEFFVEKTSIVPDPRKSNYPDCYYSILCSSPHSKNSQIILLIKCFKGYKYTGLQNVKGGDKIRAIIVPFDKLPEDEKTIQQSDTICRYDLDVWVASDVSKIENFSSGNSFTIKQKNEMEIFAENPPLSIEMKADIEKLIKEELMKINEQISSRKEKDIIPVYTKNAELLLQKYEQTKNHSDLLYWKDDSLIKVFPLRELRSEKNEECFYNCVQVITDFDRELKKRNIRLICVSFPEQWEILLPHYCVNISSVQSFSMRRLLVVRKLLENGVEVIDLGSIFKKNFSKYPYFTDLIKNDSHPMDYAIKLLTDLLNERLSRFDFSAWQYDPSLFSTRKIQNLAHLSFPDGNPKFKGIYFIETWDCRIPKDKRKASPVFVVGDSFSVTPWGTSGLRGALGNKMKMVIDGYQNQSGATRILRTISGRKYRQIANKNVVIFVITPTEWSSDRWEPLVTSNHHKKIIWELKNTGEVIFKDNNAWKKTEKGFCLFMRRDIANGPSPSSHSSSFLVRIPDKYLSDEYNLFMEADVHSPRVRLVQLTQDFSQARISAPTGFETDDDSILLKIDKDCIKDDPKKYLRFNFYVDGGTRKEIVVKNVKVFVE